MAISPFVFTSDNLPRLKAKQLVKTFPFLKLAAAQEATARALGYASWYECSQKGTAGEPSPPDLEAGLDVRVARYYHQAGVLMGLGITPSEADVWVRGWGLTGQPTLAPQRAVPVYYSWLDTIERLERGEITEDEAIEEWDEGDYSKYPEINRPQRVCPGVILAPCGKYPHYAVDPHLNASIPIYMRGPSSLYHYEDDGDVLAMCVPGFRNENSNREPFFPRLNRVQHEWHHGKKHPESKELLIPQMVKAALEQPNAMVVISHRPMPDRKDGRNFDKYAIACLRGADFAGFLQEKGVINPDKVVWYPGISSRDLDTTWRDRLDYDDADRVSLPSFNDVAEDRILPIFRDAGKHEPGPPIYSYPFMSAPMHEDEYSAFEDRLSLLPLNEDYPNDEDDDDAGDGGEDIPPWDPAPSAAEPVKSLIPG